MHEIASLDKATDRLIFDAEGIVNFYNVASRSSYEQFDSRQNPENFSTFSNGSRWDCSRWD